METFIEKESFAKLKLFCEKMSCYYFAPVYIIGSSLEKQDYNDVDLLIVLKNEHFNIRYGQTDINRLMKDVEKRWLQGCLQTGLVLDIKIISETSFVRSSFYPNTKKIRLDTSNF